MLMIFMLLVLVAPAMGTTFLHQADTQAEVEASLLAEFAGTSRPSATNDTMLAHEAALRPMYNAVPQKADGTLQHTVVRYVLHRYFAQRGWFIRGLEPGTGAKNSSSGSDSLLALEEWVPTFLQNFLVQLIGGRGISLRELAILAATLEDLVHKETISRLKKAFFVLKLPHSAQLDEEQVQEVLEVFMMIFREGDGVVRDSRLVLSPTAARFAQDYYREHAADWEQVQLWMHTVQQKVHPNTGSLDFDAMVSIVEEIGTTYGTYNKKECASLKAELLEAESQKAGRVRLGDFYKAGRSGDYQFIEKIDYLRVLGALDETDPEQPYVIVPNYVSSRPNCMVTSHFYVMCCSNQCEDLMGKLEKAVASELASPEQIIQLVSALASDTVVAPRFLGATLKRRLYSIAESNAGQVPLHGRLFAQWMHHAFPRECPFPHKDGTTNPQTADEWMQMTGHESAKASAEEIKAHADHDTEAKPKGAESKEQYQTKELPWSEVEELAFGRVAAQSQPQSLLRMISVFTILCSMVLGLFLASRSLPSTMDWQACFLKFADGKVKIGSKGGLYKMA